jgi:hypothetical protein
MSASSWPNSTGWSRRWAHERVELAELNRLVASLGA